MRKTKKTKFNIAKEVKRISREQFGVIRRGGVIVSEKYRKKPKYKSDFSKEEYQNGR